MRKVVYLPFFVVLTSLVASAQDQPQASTATINFYRAHRFEGSALKPPLYVDEIEVAHVHNGDAIQVTVTPGAHQIHSNDKSTGIELDAKAGQTYFVRVDIKTGAWKGHGQITLIDPQEGKYEFSKQQISVTRNLAANQPTPAAEHEKTPSAPAVPTAPPAQNSSAQNPTAEVQSVDQQPSLGEVARQYRDKKDKQKDQPSQPQN